MPDDAAAVRDFENPPQWAQFASHQAVLAGAPEERALLNARPDVEAAPAACRS
ncbi:hypothetical protein [Streptomyces sp. 769]|uniref:hypothetical protein n=1 Tax=Streptomyces sp. 769 TaxID=1262452 RepID=UPI00131E7053|nr:hypothetical protein [Streptomyces sp. 769]